MIERRTVLGLAAALGGLALGVAAPARAQTTEISFYYPIAVGGPVTKIVDKLAADF